MNPILHERAQTGTVVAFYTCGWEKQGAGATYAGGMTWWGIELSVVKDQRHTLLH